MHIESEACGKLQLCEYDDDAKIRHTFWINAMPGYLSRLEQYFWRSHSRCCWIHCQLYVTSHYKENKVSLVTNELYICWKLMRFNPNDKCSLLYKLSVIGPEDSLFKKALHRIYTFFEESFAEGIMWPYVGHAVGSLDAILAQTRFIMLSTYNVFPEVPVLQQFNPDHVLAELVNTSHFKFMDDNMVSFF